MTATPAPPPIDYASSADTRPRPRLPVRLLVGAALILVVLVLSATVPVRRVNIRVDSVTGSMEHRTTWVGVALAPVVTPSPLEARLNKLGIPWTRDWRTISVIEYAAAGPPLSRGCGSAPYIYGLDLSQPLVMAAATDDEVRAFAHIMQTGTEDRQRAACDALFDKMMTQAFAATRPSN